MFIDLFFKRYLLNADNNRIVLDHKLECGKIMNEDAMKTRWYIGKEKLYDWVNDFKNKVKGKLRLFYSGSTLIETTSKKNPII